MARVNLHNPDPSIDELLAQRIAEAAHGGLGGAVDAAARVGLAPGDAADVDDVSGATLGASLEDG